MELLVDGCIHPAVAIQTPDLAVEAVAVESPIKIIYQSLPVILILSP